MHVVTGELRKAIFTKSGVGQDGQSKMYGLELSEMVKDQQGNKTYTNYKALLFAKSPAHIQYYDKTLVEGNWVSLSCDKLKIEVSTCGKYTKLFMENSKIDAAGFIEVQQQAAPQQQQGGFQQRAPAQQQQGGFNQAPAQAAQQQQGGFQQQAAPQQQQQAKTPDLDEGWDDDIPF